MPSKTNDELTKDVAHNHANPRFDVYIDTSGRFRWRFIARNGRIMADSGEGYDNASNAKRAAKKFMVLMRNSVVEYQGETLAETEAAQPSNFKVTPSKE